MKHLLLASLCLSLLPVSALLAEDAAVPASPAPTAEVKYDFGDFGSATLTSKAWAAQHSGDWNAVIAYTKKCQEMYTTQALEMQAKLEAPAPKETASELWALNDVGTCTFILGGALEKTGDSSGALAAYKLLVEKMPYAQCWDPKGWFWKPADAAAGRVKELEFDSLK